MATKTTATATTVAPRMKVLYNETVAAQLQKDLGLANKHQVPRIEKVIVNVGLGRGKDDKRLFEVVRNTMTKVTGQAPVDIYAKKSIANFKIREKQSKIGMKVTLRDQRMYEFLDRLINIVLPRVRDFRGVSVKAFDPQGNYSIGIQEQSVFPELTFEETTTAHGMQVVIVVRAEEKKHSYELLKALGMPFEKKELK